MKLLLTMSIATLLLSGCGAADKANAGITGFTRKCIDKVMYYQFISGATVAYNTDGTVKACTY